MWERPYQVGKMLPEQYLQPRQGAGDGEQCWGILINKCHSKNSGIKGVPCKGYPKNGRLNKLAHFCCPSLCSPWIIFFELLLSAASWSPALAEGQGGFCGMQMNDDLCQIVCITFVGVSILDRVLNSHTYVQVSQYKIIIDQVICSLYTCQSLLSVKIHASSSGILNLLWTATD